MLAARTYMAIGDDKSAEDVLRRALKVDSRLTQAYGALAQIYMRQRRLDSAEAEFTALAELDPTPVGALTMVGTLQQMRGDTKSARAQYKRVLDLDANASVAANNLAWIYATEGGDLDAALDLARSAKRGLPDAADVGDTVGFIYYKKGLHDLAINAFEESIAKDGNNPTYHFHLGLASAKAGYAPQARQHLSMALKLNPAFDGAAEAKRVLGSLW
jgi:tetratricopeptide (TPR) repeat protein